MTGKERGKEREREIERGKSKRRKGLWQVRKEKRKRFSLFAVPSIALTVLRLNLEWGLQLQLRLGYR